MVLQDTRAILSQVPRAHVQHGKSEQEELDVRYVRNVEPQEAKDKAISLLQADDVANPQFD